MKSILIADANSYLGKVGLKIGEWGKVLEVGDDGHGDLGWVNYQAPKSNLLNFSQYVSSWLPKGKWKIFQIDDSTGWMDPVQVSLFAGLLYGADHVQKVDFNKQRTFLFEFGDDENANKYTELLISNLIYLFFRFELHGYVVSSNGESGRYLGIQDGFAYFFSKDIDNASALLEEFENNPGAPPEWVINIIADAQEELISNSG